MVRTSGARSSEARAKISLLSWMLAPANTFPAGDRSSWSSCSSAKPSMTSASTSGSRSSTSRPRLSARSARSALPPCRPSMTSARPDRPSTVARGSGVSLIVPAAPAAVAGRRGRGCRVPLGHHPVDLVDQLVELRGPAAARPGQRVAHVGADPAGVGAQHQDAVGEQDRFLDVVRHHHDGLGREALALPQLQQLTAQVLRGQHVQRAERLVHQQGRGLDHQRPGEADALAHAARQLLGVGGLVTVQADDVDGPQRALGPLGGGHPAGLQAQLHVLLHGEPRQQREGLEDHGGLPVAAGQPLAAEQHPALGGRDQPGDAAQQGGLAAAAAAEQGHELALGHVEVDVVEHRDGPPGRAGERLAQRPHADQRLAAGLGLGRGHASANLVSASAYRRRHSSTFRPVT